MPLKRDWKREMTICDAYLAGETLASIGNEYGITSERVRQILKRNNITSADSPRKDILAKEKAESQKRMIRRRFKRQCEILKSYNCRRLIIREMRMRFKESGLGNAPFIAYKQQRHNSIYRGIPWAINFLEWWDVWAKSGKWEYRGRELGQYVMGRINDLGPYQKDNVYIITCSQNITEGYEQKMKSGVVNDQQLR